MFFEEFPSSITMGETIIIADQQGTRCTRCAGDRILMVPDLMALMESSFYNADNIIITK